jgi:ribonuclease P protein subunit RPR2
MAKKKAPGVPNKSAYSRLSFMYQAATFLAAVSADQGQGWDQAASNNTCPDLRMETDGKDGGHAHGGRPRRAATQTRNMSHRMLADFRSVTLKSQIRVSPAIKRTICKFCDTLLVEGQTCTSTVENTSKGGRKPWADVLVITCHTCHHSKRFPVNAPRQQRHPSRVAKASQQGARQGVAQETQPQLQNEP